MISLPVSAGQGKPACDMGMDCVATLAASHACVRVRVRVCAEVDEMRQRKQQELEAFCREAEIAKELAKKRLAQARQVWRWWPPHVRAPLRTQGLLPSPPHTPT